MRLQTGHLLLRPVELEDWTFIFELSNKPEVKEFVLPEQSSEQYVKRAIEQGVVHHHANSGRYFAYIIHLLDTEEPIGTCVLSFPYTLRRIGTMGWQVRPQFQGKGYATEASSELLRLGFGPCRMRRIRAECFVDNAASRRVMEKLGMRQSHGIWTRLNLYWDYTDTGKKVRYEITRNAWLEREWA